jgi:hypothetical protein
VRRRARHGWTEKSAGFLLLARQDRPAAATANGMKDGDSTNCRAGALGWTAGGIAMLNS